MQWQYKTTKIELGGILSDKVNPAEIDAVFNQLGRDCWELVSAVRFPGELRATAVVSIFKRPFQDSSAPLMTRGICPSCGYDLRGAEHSACPECGWKA